MARARRKGASVAVSELPPLSKFQKFTPYRLARERIRNAPYNPRKIDQYSKEKLRKKLKTRGLLAPVVWNERTGNMVSGHQRLAILDALEGTPEYSVDVARVDLTEKQEREECIFFNNPGAQGQWDLPLLAPLLPELDLGETGFDPIDIEVLFEDTEFEDMFGQQLEADERERAERTEHESKRRHPGETKDQAHTRIRRERDEHLDRSRQEDDTEFYVVAVFQSRGERQKFMEAMGRDPDERYLDGRELSFRCGITEKPDD